MTDESHVILLIEIRFKISLVILSLTEKACLLTRDSSHDSNPSTNCPTSRFESPFVTTFSTSPLGALSKNDSNFSVVLRLPLFCKFAIISPSRSGEGIQSGPYAHTVKEHRLLTLTIMDGDMGWVNFDLDSMFHHAV